jgi:hypothetical protein
MNQPKRPKQKAAKKRRKNPALKIPPEKLIDCMTDLALGMMFTRAIRDPETRKTMMEVLFKEQPPAPEDFKAPADIPPPRRTQ